jgi:integrase
VPKKTLTDAVVQRFKLPATGQVDVFDKGYPGLSLRVSYGGGKSFVFFYRIGGRLRRMTLGTYPAMSLADAREAWRKARQDAKSGRDPSQAGKHAPGATDFKNVAAEWILRDQAKNKSRRIVARLIDVNVLTAWEHRQITEIGRRDVLDVIDAIVDRGAVVTARRVQAHLHRLFAWALGRGIVDKNPLAGLPKPGEETPRKRILSDDELLMVWRASEQLGWPFGHAIRLLILTGARREEIGQLRWAEIDERSINLAGTRTKSGEPHSIPLSAPARAIIESLPRIKDSELTFTIDGKKPVSAWSRAKAKVDELANIEPWRIHDLRRTTATGLQKLKVPLTVTEAVLGHISGSRAGIVSVYQVHDYADEKQAALSAWGAHVIALVEGKKPGEVLPMRGKR